MRTKYDDMIDAIRKAFIEYGEMIEENGFYSSFFADPFLFESHRQGFEFGTVPVGTTTTIKAVYSITRIV